MKIQWQKVAVLLQTCMSPNCCLRSRLVYRLRVVYPYSKLLSQNAKLLSQNES